MRFALQMAGSHDRAEIRKKGCEFTMGAIKRLIDSVRLGAFEQADRRILGTVNRHLAAIACLLTLHLAAFADPFAVLANLQSPVDYNYGERQLAADANGRLYGVQTLYDASTSTRIYAVDADGSNFQVLRTLSISSDGAGPCGGLLLGADGRLYGVASFGGPGYAGGTIFAMETDGTGFVLLHVFQGNGSRPLGGLTQGPDGRLFGTTHDGGLYGAGTIFSLQSDGSGFIVLRNLNSATDGAYPTARLTLANDGKLYGTTYNGGPAGKGTVFVIGTDGSGFSVVSNLSESGAVSQPNSGVIQGMDGRLYGTGGATSFVGGSLYAVRTDGSGFTVLRIFDSVLDENPVGRFPDIYFGLPRDTELVQGADGRIFGVLPIDVAPTAGVAYAIEPDGTAFKIIHAFEPATDGASPLGGLVEGPDGRLYGATSSGGALGAGTVYSIDPIPDVVPWISSRTSATGTFGNAFTYSITATRSPFEFDAVGLPAGLAVDNTSGVISGIPAASGTFMVTVAATNSEGTGYADLELTIQRKNVVITISDTTQDYDGTPKWVTVATIPEGHPVTVTYEGNSIAPTEIGSYAVSATVDEINYRGTASATLAIVPAGSPKITEQPQDVASPAGKNVTFTVKISSPTSVGYQWFKDGVPVAGATAPTLRINKVKSVDQGVYSVVATNSVGSVTSNGARLTVTGPPTITTQPTSKTVAPGAQVAFTVTVGGVGSLSYQWRKNGTPITGANSYTLYLINVQSADAGSYDVVVTNEYGSVTSDAATLTVIGPLVITQQPESQTVRKGRSVTFSVTASGVNPLSYQWFKDGTMIAGAISPSLQLTKVTSADEGSYTVTVSNLTASVTSNAATLTIR